MSSSKRSFLNEYISKNMSIDREISYSMTIRFQSETPFRFAPRRLSYLKKDKVDNIVAELLNKNIFCHSNSPYAPPIVLVKKKNGETSMCVDYRSSLNKLTLRENYPIPLIEDFLD